MSEKLEFGSPAIPVNLRRSTRARRLSLRVSRLDGRVTLTLPYFVSLAEGRSFLAAREDWLRAQLAEVAPAQQVRFGDSLPLRGEMLRLVPANRSMPQVEANHLLLPANRPIGPVLRAFLKETARVDLSRESRAFAAALGRDFGKITLRDTRSRWGSCSARGDLMYSWRLIMAPPKVLSYVAAHEVAHLQEMNHSSDFWALVGQLMPDWQVQRDWLRAHGAALHKYHFKD